MYTFERHNLKRDNKFMFNDYDLSYLAVVERVTRQFIPTTSIQSSNINGGKGLAFKRKDVGSRLITVDLRFIEDSYEQLQERATQLASLLYSDEPQKLYLRDSLLYNKAMLLSGESFERNLNTGYAQIVFECLDPYNYGDEITVQLSGVNPINNPGAETVGVVSAVTTGGIVKVTLDSGDYILLNNEFEIGAEIVIDLEKETVMSTSGSIMNLVTLESDFFKIPSGKSSITVEGATGTLKYVERWI